jgi:uncharacterized membrane protein (DUF2068 family)
VRFVPRHWSNETWICSIRGHVTPAATAAELGPGDGELGLDRDDHERLSRCLRCDGWIAAPAPSAADAAYERVPPLDELDLPRRGKPLEDAILLRLIAIERGIHGVLFTVLAVVLLLVHLDLPRIQHWAESVRTDLTGAIDNTGSSGHARLATELNRVAHLSSSTITVLLVTAVIYAVVESVEAIGLWHERRWAEYLTVVATAGFLPFEIRELLDRVTVLRVGALVVNVAILVYLVWAKHLFGLRGGASTLDESVDWSSIVPRAGPEPAAVLPREVPTEPLPTEP